jgi:sulfate adenylyltransferase subunit 1
VKSRQTPLPITIVGHVDHGKSTLIGRLLLDTGSLPKEKIAEIKKISESLGRGAELAYITDQLKEEREQSITIDTTQIFFRGKKRNYVIIDTPGHAEFIKNTLTGASLAHAAILIVDAFEGIMEQTKRHAFLLRLLGIDQVIVLFNKMDRVDYNTARFVVLNEELNGFLRKLSIKPSFSIPASAKTGQNISSVASQMPWYKGPTLLQGLDGLRHKKEAPEGPLRFPVQDVYHLDGEKVVVGRIESGRVRRSQPVKLYPSGCITNIKAIKIYGKNPKTAGTGESVGLVFDNPGIVERGFLVSGLDDPPRYVSSFYGSLFWLAEEPFRVDRGYRLQISTQEVSCIAVEIARRIDTSTLEILEEKAEHLQIRDLGQVVLKTKSPVAVEEFKSIPELGRFVVKNKGYVLGAGIIVYMGDGSEYRLEPEI